MSNQATRLAEELRRWADAIEDEFGDFPTPQRHVGDAGDCAAPVMREAADALLALVQPAVSEEARWQPIETVPEGVHILLWFARGERGNGGMETATVFRDPNSRSGFSFWTHGGPNGGTDWELEDAEAPTHWMALPDKQPAT